LHTNDIHGHYLPSKATWLDHEPDIGGFEALSYYVNRERGKAENSILLDAGDLMTGSVLCDIEYEGALGGALIAMMNRIGYDGMVPGNHEFDVSVTNFWALNKLADFPIICANMAKGDAALVDEAYHIYDVGELKVGVIGLTYYPMRGMVSDPNLEGFDSMEPEALVDSLVSLIDPVTDVVIILSHMGLDQDRLLAEVVEGVDIIVGGHSHIELQEPERVNKVLIVQAGSNCRYLGRIDLTVTGDSIVDYSSMLIPMFTENIQPDPGISKMVARFSSETEELYGRTIGKLDDRWAIEYGKESILGNWVTDALRKRLHTDLAIINSGAMRKDLGPGKITVGDIHELLPFNNRIVTFGCSGRQLLRIAEQNIDYEAEGYIYPLQISGMNCVWRKADGGNEIVDISVNGQPIDSSRIYHIASLDYIVIYNSERYFGYKVRAYINTKYRLPQLIIDEIEKNGISESDNKNRFSEIE
jgi:5'-nucleotidase/UDP-sugar diphosphatase